MSFKYTQKGGKLTSKQSSLLEQIETAVSPYQGITCLKDLRRLSGVSVIVSDRGFLRKQLIYFIERIETQIRSYEEERNLDNRRVYRQIEGDIYPKLEKAKKELEQIDNPDAESLLGLYTRNYLWFDDSSPYVILFADNIDEYASKHRTNVDHVFGYVFIHEMMHAYYDAFNSDGYPARHDLEEAFAEFGMLTFINKTPSLGFLINDASDNVKSKRTKYGPCEYGFGYDLFTLTGGGNPNMMNRYKDISNWIDLDVIFSWPGKHNYFHDMLIYRRDPLDSVNSKNCHLGVMEILGYDWKQPDTIIQRAVKPSRISLPGHSAGEWALTATAAEDSLQSKLLHCADKMSFFEEIVKALKKERIEDYLSLDGSSHITFLGKILCEYSTTSSGSRTLSESFCVSGTIVYPVILQPAASTDNLLIMKQFRSLLHAACVLYDAEFTVVREASGFTLYGPDSCAASFVTPIIPATGSGRVLGYSFDANSSWRGNGKQLFFTIPANVANDASFSSKYIPKTGINIKFYGKAGISFTGDASILGQGRIGIRAELRDEYAKYFGKHDHRAFHFREIMPSDGTKPAEWEAHEK